MFFNKVYYANHLEKHNRLLLSLCMKICKANFVIEIQKQIERR